MSARPVVERCPASGPFVLEGEDGFALSESTGPTWPEVREAVGVEHGRLSAVVADSATGRASSALTDAERFDLVLGIACHAIHRAGQAQLIKRLRAE